MDLPALPKTAPVKCGECSNFLVLRHNDLTYMQARDRARWPFYYRCQNSRCAGLVMAGRDGLPIAIPAAFPVRKARSMAHDAFDKLWLTAHKVPEYRHAFGKSLQGRKTDRAALVRTARERAYLYMAHQLGIEPFDCHIGRMTDLAMLNRLTAIAHATTAKAVFRWWKQEGKRLYGGKKIPARLTDDISVAYIETSPSGVA